MNQDELLAQNERFRTLLQDAAIAMASAHRDMMSQCCSNPIQNAWGQQIDVSSINDLQGKVNTIARELGDFDVTSVVYGQPGLHHVEDDFYAFYARSLKAITPEMQSLVESRDLRDWSLTFWEQAGAAKHSVVSRLQSDLAMALDAAQKGDQARMTAGGMEMSIGELSVEVAKRDILLADMLHVISELPESALDPRMAKGYRTAIEGMRNHIAKPWDGKSIGYSDLLPPVGSIVSIKLASSDKWVNHVVTGYYAWENMGNDPSVHRIFVRVRDSSGYPNARLLDEVRAADYQGDPENEE